MTQLIKAMATPVLPMPALQWISSFYGFILFSSCDIEMCCDVMKSEQDLIRLVKDSNSCSFGTRKSRHAVK